MIAEDEMTFNDRDDDYCEPLLDAWEREIKAWYDQQYSGFDSMMEQMKQDISEYKKYGAIWEAADKYAEEEAYCEVLLEEDERLIDPESTDDYDWKYEHSECGWLSYYSAPDGWNTMFKVEEVLGDVWGYKHHYYIEYQSETHCFTARIEKVSRTPDVFLGFYKLNGDHFIKPIYLSIALSI
jgi:hypothetical protein